MEFHLNFLHEDGTVKRSSSPLESFSELKEIVAGLFGI
jgi:hypothetical protein